MEKTTLHIEGMDCANCALGITKKLESRGLQEVSVNFATGEAQFATSNNITLAKIVEDITSLGYTVVDKPLNSEEKQGLSDIEKKFYISLIFTIPLFFSHMLFSHDFILNNPLVQLALCIPVFTIGILKFGKSAWGSLKSRVPNMDVLIFIGTTAAFVYSLAGTIIFYDSHQVHNYLFYETAATIITLVLLGNLLEHRSVKQTTTAIKDLTKMQVLKAKRVIIENKIEKTEEVDFTEIKVGDVLLINDGDKVPVDGEVISGNATIDESMISGESIPVEKGMTSKVIGGTIVLSGNFKILAEQVGNETVLSKIIELVKNAQHAKPEIQKLGDKISAVFVPIVLGISILTFFVNHFFFDKTIAQSLMNSIAVLVISCPCAMGLATPTAVMVGIGRAAKRGILIKGGNTLELFAGIKNIVFDKTGTLTTGNFKIKAINLLGKVSESEIQNILYNLEQHSSHPIAKSIVSGLKGKAIFQSFKNIIEEKGIGIIAEDENKNTYKIGSFKIASNITMDDSHEVYVLKNELLIATIDLEDEVKASAKSSLAELNSNGIETIMLSGDHKNKCSNIASQLNISNFYAEQLPSQKLDLIEKLNSTSPTAMVGDGINDAPALAKATVGISLSSGTQVAIQSAQIVLLNGNDLSKIVEAYNISTHTLITIKQNLFWAFFYNIVAIPIAAAGFLSPMIGALSMAFSDVIVIGNSIRLKTKNLK